MAIRCRDLKRTRNKNNTDAWKALSDASSYQNNVLMQTRFMNCISVWYKSDSLRFKLKSPKKMMMYIYLYLFQQLNQSEIEK